MTEGLAFKPFITNRINTNLWRLVCESDAHRSSGKVTVSLAFKTQSKHLGPLLGGLNNSRQARDEVKYTTLSI